MLRRALCTLYNNSFSLCCKDDSLLNAQQLICALLSGMQAATGGQAGHMIQQQAMGVASANNMPHAQMHYQMHPHHQSEYFAQKVMCKIPQSLTRSLSEVEKVMIYFILDFPTLMPQPFFPLPL